MSWGIVSDSEFEFCRFCNCHLDYFMSYKTPSGFVSYPKGGNQTRTHCLTMWTIRVFQKHTKLAKLSLLPTLYSHIFVSTNASKCEIRNQEVCEDYTWLLQALLNQLIFSGKAKTKLAVLVFLYCGGIVKTVLQHTGKNRNETLWNVPWILMGNLIGIILKVRYSETNTFRTYLCTWLPDI